MSRAEYKLALLKMAHRIRKSKYLRKKPFYNYLDGLANAMTELGEKSRLSNKDLSDISFAIFRYVTDDSHLEDSRIGQELLKLSCAVDDVLSPS
jgi:hypothetical protein